MFSLTLAQMRRSLGRLAAAGIAITIGTAFVAATLLAGDVVKRSSYDAVAATYADASLVLRPAPDSATLLTGRDLEAVRGVDGVDAADPVATGYAVIGSGSRVTYQAVIDVGSDPRLQPLELVEGRLPTVAGEIALPADVVSRLETSIGSTVDETVSVEVPVAGSEVAADGTTETTWRDSVEPLRVVGIVADPYGAYATWGGAGIVVDDALAGRADLGPDQAQEFREIAVALAPGTDVAAATTALAGAVDSVRVLTKDEAAASSVSSITGGENVFMMSILSFAAISLLVAALVISNTFQVIVAQRTRTLALLRCVGASKKQLRGSVVLEATILGLVSSAVGFLAGAGLVQVTVLVLQRVDLAIPIPQTITITLASVLWPLAVGTLVTVLASLVPARAATRVAPLAALRPADPGGVSVTSSRTRLVASTLLVVAGVVGLGGGLALSSSASVELGLLVGLAGGAASFVGVLLGSVFWIPRVVSGVARLLSRLGASAQLAAANTVRNPRRTAATSTALLIGVTLVAMMSVGAATARVSLSDTLDERYPVDVSIDSGDVAGPVTTDGSEPATDPETSAPDLTPALVDRLAGVPGVAALAEVSASSIDVTWPDGSTSSQTRLVSVDPVAASAAVNPPGLFTTLGDASVVVDSGLAWSYSLEDGDRLTLAGPQGEVEVTVTVADLGTSEIVASTSVGTQVSSATTTTGVWINISSADQPAGVVDDLRDVLAETPVSLAGAALERASMQQVIDTVLAVIVGLLGIAVVIALIGVANTLSLSVLERRRESATLRAIGLSRRQLRATLAIEGTVIAGVGAVLGIVLGALYGWIGATIVLGQFAGVSLVVPWRDLVLVVAISLAAGLLASVLPARTAARTSPVEALAVE